MTAMRLSMGLRDFVTPHNHRLAAQTIRHIASRFPEYNITGYHPYWPFVDQYLIILPNTFQNIVIAMSVMLLVAFLIIPSVFGALLVSISVLSIDIGVIGYMTWWGVNLDAISMITVIMSIGFAVDLSAHICYAFAAAQGTPKDKATKALVHMGTPVLQGALSTILGVFVLATIDAYMIVTFFKTILLVIVFGILHGLVFIPIALAYGTIGLSRIRLWLWEKCWQKGKGKVAVEDNGISNTVVAKGVSGTFSRRRSNALDFQRSVANFFRDPRKDRIGICAK